jgi:hypothetical protein
MSFTRISHYKFFNEAMCTQVYNYLFIFPTMFAHRDVGDIIIKGDKYQFTATPIHPVYMYKIRERSINRIQFIVLII